MSHHLKGRGHIVFGVDSVGVGVLALASAVALASLFLVCTISCEPVVGFLLNFY